MWVNVAGVVGIVVYFGILGFLLWEGRDSD